MHFKVRILTEMFDLEERITQAQLLKRLALFSPTSPPYLPA
jgi:hypothetical protein